MCACVFVNSVLTNVCLSFDFIHVSCVHARVFVLMRVRVCSNCVLVHVCGTIVCGCV